MVKSRIKLIKKLISAIVILFLITTVFSQSFSAKGFLSDFKDKLDSRETPIIDKVKDKTKDVLDDTNKLTFNVRRHPVVNTILMYSSLKSQSSSLGLYAKLGHIEKETQLSVGVPKKLDINNDGKNDISVKLGLRFGIEKPLALSLNFNLNIERLSGISNNKDYLEVYTTLSFPGMLDAGMKDDQVVFGFLSDQYEEIPDTCSVSYKYVPYFFYKNKPKHIADLNPGSIKNDEKLSLVFGYKKSDGSNTISEDIFKISCEPAVKINLFVDGISGGIGKTVNLDLSKSTTTVITYERSANNSFFEAGLIVYKLSSFSFDIKLTPFKRGGGKVEFQRNSETHLDALLYFESANSSKSNYFYVYDLPSHILLTWLPNQNSLIKVDTFNERCKEIGWRNALFESDVTAKAYIKNLPSYFEINWIGKLTDGKVEISSDLSGVSVHVFAQELTENGGYLTADLYSGENFDFSIYWDFSRQVFGISRSNADLSLYVSIYDLLYPGLSANFSCKVKNQITSPFEFSFDELLDFDVKLEFTGNDFELSNLNVDVNIPNIGKVILKMASFKMSRQSSMILAFSIDNTDDEYEVTCDIDITNGVEIYGIIIGFNDFMLPIDDIVVNGQYSKSIQLSVTQGFVQFRENEDGSTSAIISGGINLYFNSDYVDSGILKAHIEGTVSFLAEDSVLIVTWDSTGAITVDGSAVVSLTGFNLWVKDKINISIPAIVGKFSLNSAEQLVDLQLVLDKSKVSFVSDFSIDIEDFEEITIQADVSFDCTVSLSGYVSLSYSPDTGLVISTGGGGVGFNGDATISNLYVKYGDMLEMSVDKISVHGKLSFSFSITPGSSTSIGVNAGEFSLKIENFDLDSDFLVASFNELYMGGEGFVRIGLGEDYKVVVLDVDGRVHIYGLDVPAYGIALSFGVDLTLAGELSYSTQNDKLTVHIYGHQPVEIDNFYFNLNHGQILASWDTLHLDVSAYAEVTMSSMGIKLDASLEYVNFDNAYILIDSNEMEIEGSFSLSAGGLLEIKVNTESNPNYIKVDLESGVADINNFYFTFSQTGLSLDVDFNNLHIEATAALYVKIKNSGSSKKISLDAEGKGLITLVTFSVSGNIDDDISPVLIDINLDYFKFELDDIKGSVIGLELSDKIKINSASGEASLSQLVITNLYVTINQLETNAFLANITNLKIDLSGSGYFSMDLTEPDNNGVQELSMLGSITTDGFIEVDFLAIWFSPIFLNMTNFRIDGPTTFHLNAEGILNAGNGIDLESLEFFHLDAGCTTTWSADKLYLYGLLGFDDLEGVGDLTVGADFVGINEKGHLLGDFIVHPDGEWDWSAFYLFIINLDGNFLTEPSAGAGTFNGDLEIRIDLQTFIAGLSFDFTNLPDEIKFKTTAYDTTTITQVDFANIISGVTILLEPGVATINVNNFNLADINSGIFDDLELIIDSTGYISFTVLSVDLSSYVEGMQVSLGSLSMNSGQIKVNLNKDYNQQTLRNEIQVDFISTFDITLSVGSIELLGSDLKFDWLDFELHPGTVTVNAEWENGFEKGLLIIESSGTFDPTIDEFKLTDTESGKSIKLLSTEFDVCDYLKVEWDADVIGGNPDFDGFVYITTNGEPLLSLEVYLFGIIRIRAASIDAIDFKREWDWNINDGDFEILGTEGTWDADTFTIDIMINGQYRSLYLGFLDSFTVEAGGPYSAEEGEEIQFTFSVIDPGANNAPYNYVVDWGDGSEVYDSWHGDLVYLSHMYPEDGTYAVTVTATCSLPSTDTDDDTAQVTISNLPLYADAGGPYEDVPVGETLQLSGSATGGESPYSYHWDFGDGETSNQQNPTHQYQTSGTFDITLTVTDNDGITATDTSFAEVSIGAITVTLEADTMQAFVGDTVTFTATVSAYGNINLVYRFDFDGDGSYDHVKHSSQKTYSINHVYNDFQYWPVGFAPKVLASSTSDSRSDSDTLYYVEIYPLTDISGVVTDQGTGLPIQGATVTCEGSSDTTDSTGEYNLDVRITNGGSHSITASKSGYITRTESIHIPAPGNVLTKDIELLSSSSNDPPESYVYAYKQISYYPYWSYIGGTYQDTSISGDTTSDYAFTPDAPSLHPYWPDSHDPDGEVTHYRWVVDSVGDSGWKQVISRIKDTEDEFGPIQWTNPGSYDVTLYLRDDDGAESQATLIVNIS